MGDTILAVLGAGILDAATPVIRADDPGVTRGDGCFEGIRVLTDDSGRSVIAKLDRHLARFARSAAALEIPFDAPGWQALIEQASAAWTTPGEAGLRAVLTRGAPGAGPTGFLTITPAPADYPAQRANGISAVTVARGYPSEAFAAAPWLLGGVKTLSYAVNMAAHREAERRGAVEAVFVSADGFVLEAPTGSLVWASDGRLVTTPVGATGILAGTTQDLLFDNAAADGWATTEELITVEALHRADAAWVVSSLRGPVEIVSLDGRERARRPELHARVRALSGF